MHKISSTYSRSNLKPRVGIDVREREGDFSFLWSSIPFELFFMCMYNMKVKNDFVNMKGNKRQSKGSDKLVAG